MESAVVMCGDWSGTRLSLDGFRISYTTAIVGGLYLMQSFTGSA